MKITRRSLAAAQAAAQRLETQAPCAQFKAAVLRVRDFLDGAHAKGGPLAKRRSDWVEERKFLPPLIRSQALLRPALRSIARDTEAATAAMGPANRKDATGSEVDRFARAADRLARHTPYLVSALCSETTLALILRRVSHKLNRLIAQAAAV